jgi:hypothetical protein
MAINVKLIRKIKFGNAFGVVAELTGDTSYATGGYPLTAKQLGLNVVENVLPQSPAGGKFWEYDFANEKIKILRLATTAELVEEETVYTTALAEVANNSNQSESVARIVAFGW